MSFPTRASRKIRPQRLSTLGLFLVLRGGGLRNRLKSVSERSVVAVSAKVACCIDIVLSLCFAFVSWLLFWHWIAYPW